MVELAFGPSTGSPSELAYTTSEDLDTVFIPFPLREHTIKWLMRQYKLSREVAEEIADSFLEQVYPTTLGHEAAHLVLGRLADKEGLPIDQAMEGYHNPYTREDEMLIQGKALSTAIKQAYEKFRKTK